ncbi:MAG: GNAT family N-acetyltransferase [Candidatus Nanoarchaeia archaeon]
MKHLPVLEGRLVKLDAFALNYINIYHEWMQDKYIQDMIGKHENLTIDDIIGMHKEWEESSDIAHFLVFDRETSKPIGDVELHDIKYGESAVCRIMIGDYRFRDKGFGAEAYKLLFEYGFKTFNLKKITAYVFCFNSPALRLHRKLGFLEVGRVKDDIVFELVRHQSVRGSYYQSSCR